MVMVVDKIFHLQQTSSIGLPNNTSRPTLTLGQSVADCDGLPLRTLQYTSNNVMQTAYTYETPNTWIPNPQQIPLLQTNESPQMNAASSLTFDSIQQVPSQSQQTTYIHPKTYEAAGRFPQQFQ
ncbi:unnamed protein product [Rotaria socialis]|uniref:Uncharacterized protein n=1 Tax=Rotaria socialis TaxID=392032 RepID=A0A817ZBV5_9BILA|nr:unnamed protein product [Rotaria socialis]CAF4330818.1 unnamed protein product [Rotaria socialis]